MGQKYSLMRKCVLDFFFFLKRKLSYRLGSQKRSLCGVDGWGGGVTAQLRQQLLPFNEIHTEIVSSTQPPTSLFLSHGFGDGGGGGSGGGGRGGGGGARRRIAAQNADDKQSDFDDAVFLALQSTFHVGSQERISEFFFVCAAAQPLSTKENCYQLFFF